MTALGFSKGAPFSTCLTMFCVCVVTALGFSKGAPFSTCLTMFPKHGHTEQQEGPPPFFLTLSPHTYRPGQIVTGEWGVDVHLH